MAFHYLEESRAKLERMLSDDESLSIQELKQCENLNLYRDWLVKIIKQATDLQEACNSEVIEEVQNLRQQVETINDLAIKNEELEDQNRQLLDEIESYKENEAAYHEQKSQDYSNDYEPVSSPFTL
jgi:cell shape-determining protein MreC